MNKENIAQQAGLFFRGQLSVLKLAHPALECVVAAE
jgi:hypothetical protein